MQCLLCGDIIPAEVSRCPACGAWSRHRDFRALGVAVFMLLGFNAFVALGSGISLIRLERPLRAQTRDTFEPDLLQRVLASYTELFVASAALASVTGVLYLAWLWRAFEQVSGPRPCAQGWVVAGWLIPVVNLWLPPTVVHAVWLNSSGHHPVERERATSVVTAWWVSLLSAITLIMLFAAIGADSLAQARFSVHVAMAATATLALAAALCMVTVFRITRLQVHRPD